MHFLYLDASGDPGWCPPVGRSATKWYVLLGLSFEESVWEKAHQKTKEIVNAHLPFPLANLRELRYSSLLAGAPPYDQMTPLQRKNLADDLFALILDLKPVLFAAAIQKEKHRAQYGVNALSPSVWALQLIAPRFHKYLLRIDARGIFIMDAEETKKDAKLKELIQTAREHGIVLKSSFRPFLGNTKLPRIIESVLFEDSRESPGLQLADFCSHAVWKHFERGKSYRFNQIYPLFDSHGGVVYGLKTWP